MNKTLRAKILVKRGSQSEWESLNPVLLAGEIGADTTNRTIKVGNGTSRWDDLPYISGGESAEDTIQLTGTSGTLSEHQQSQLNKAGTGAIIIVDEQYKFLFVGNQSENPYFISIDETGKIIKIIIIDKSSGYSWQISTQELANSEDVAEIRTSVSEIDAKAQETASKVETQGEKIEGVTSEVNTLKTQVNTNTTDITTNKADIANLKTKTETNATDIASNKSDLSNLKTSTATNTANIATNKSNIATNKSNIATNKTDIATNKASISALSMKVDKNATDIATNTSNIATNKSGISELKVYIDGEIDALDESLGDTINKNYDKLVGVVDDKIASAISGLYTYKGSVATVDDLAKTGNKKGDVYNVESTGMNYAWTGTAWDALGGTLDIEIVQATGASTTAIMSQKAVTEQLAANARRIGENETNIATNTATIATNAEKISDLGEHDTQLEGNITIVKEQVQALENNFTTLDTTVKNQVQTIDDIEEVAYTNKSDIAAIQTSVSDNTTNIATNKANIATNKADIATIKKNVDTNATNIATNMVDISVLATKTNTNTTNIATNKMDISTLSGVVSTNTTNIATNKSSIETMQTSKQDKLTAGDNITIVNNVISASGGGSSTTDVIRIIKSTIGKALSADDLAFVKATPEKTIVIIDGYNCYYQNNGLWETTTAQWNEDSSGVYIPTVRTRRYVLNTTTNAFKSDGTSYDYTPASSSGTKYTGSDGINVDNTHNTINALEVSAHSIGAVSNFNNSGSSSGTTAESYALLHAINNENDTLITEWVNLKQYHYIITGEDSSYDGTAYISFSIIASKEFTSISDLEEYSDRICCSGGFISKNAELSGIIIDFTVVDSIISCDVYPFQGQKFELTINDAYLDIITGLALK